MSPSTVAGGEEVLREASRLDIEYLGFYAQQRTHTSVVSPQSPVFTQSKLTQLDDMKVALLRKILGPQLVLREVADGSTACCVASRGAAVGSRPAPRRSTQRRNTESRRQSSLASAPIDRPLEATRSTSCCSSSSVNDRRSLRLVRHLLALRAYYRCPLIRRRFRAR